MVSMQGMAFDAARLDGLSEKLVRSHHENNYGGAVKRLAAIRAQLAQLDWSAAPNFAINGLKREELVAANSAWLHELYFACLGGNGEVPPGGMSVALARDFGSVDRWRAEFTALAKAMGGGSGWALLSWSAREQRLLTHWAADHTHLPGGATPILALDMYEHAYHMDFGANAGAYVAAFMRNIDWKTVGEHYATAVAGQTAAWAVQGDEIAKNGARVIDVRRAGAFEAAGDMVSGATWADPERVDEWSASLSPAQPVVLYCVYGHEVGQSTVAILRSRGIEASYLEGGIEAWKKAGLPVQPRGEPK